MTYNNGIIKVMGVECEYYEEVADVLKTSIHNAITNKKTFDEIVDMFDDDDIEYMRQYFNSSDYPFYDISPIYTKAIIYAFMRLMAAEYIVADNNIGLATDICKYLQWIR